MIVSLRPHHLLCMLTYLGKGYTPDFVRTYDRVMARLNAGASVEIVSGPDDICQGWLLDDGCHCHNDSVLNRDAAAARDIGRLLQTDIAPGQPLRLGPEHIATLRGAFAKGQIRTACRGCEWQAMCSAIATRGFKGCHLSPGA